MKYSGDGCCLLWYAVVPVSMASRRKSSWRQQFRRGTVNTKIEKYLLDLLPTIQFVFVFFFVELVLLFLPFIGHAHINMACVDYERQLLYCRR